MTDTVILSGKASVGGQDDLRVGFAPASLLTRAEMLDHVRHPRNRGVLVDATVRADEVNPLCGDEVTIFALLDGSCVQRMTFAGAGCIISQAAASMLSEAVVGKSVADIQRMERAEMEMLLGGRLSPSRVKCAMLPLLALKNGLEGYARGS